jgi:hypothetical protein
MNISDIESIFETLEKNDLIEIGERDPFLIELYKDRLNNVIIHEKLFGKYILGWHWVDDDDCGDPVFVKPNDYSPDSKYDLYPICFQDAPAEVTLKEHIEHNRLNNDSKDPSEYVFNYHRYSLEVIPDYTDSLDSIHAIEEKIKELNLEKKYSIILYDIISFRIEDIEEYSYTLFHASKKDKIQAIMKLIKEYLS